MQETGKVGLGRLLALLKIREIQTNQASENRDLEKLSAKQQDPSDIPAAVRVLPPPF
jgi:hypothetical protein